MHRKGSNMKKLYKFVRCLFMVALLYVAVFATLLCARNVLRHNRAADTKVTINATVSRYEHYTEHDKLRKEDRWRVYISYHYDGTNYSDVFYEHAYRQPQLGKTVSVKIDPANPGEILPGKMEFYVSLFCIPSMLTVIGLFIYDRLLKYMRRRAASQEFGKEEALRRAPYQTFAILAALMLGSGIVFYIFAHSFLYLLSGLIALILPWYFSRHPRDWTSAK